MAYEGGVNVMNEDGTEFTFDSAEAVAWLQMYVDMVAAGTVDTDALTTALDRVALLIFSAGQARVLPDWAAAHPGGEGQQP